MTANNAINRETEKYSETILYYAETYINKLLKVLNQQNIKLGIRNHQSTSPPVHHHINKKVMTEQTKDKTTTIA